MAAALPWETVLRAGVSHSLARRGCRRGWSVANHRGLVRLNITANSAGDRRSQLLLPIPWDGDHVDEVRDAAVALHSAFQDGEDLDEALVHLFPGDQLQASTGKEAFGRSAPDAHVGVSWPALVELYRDRKLCSGEVKDATWERMYRPRMSLIQRFASAKSNFSLRSFLRIPR